MTSDNHFQQEKNNHIQPAEEEDVDNPEAVAEQSTAATPVVPETDQLREGLLRNAFGIFRLQNSSKLT